MKIYINNIEGTCIGNEEGEKDMGQIKIYGIQYRLDPVK